MATGGAGNHWGRWDKRAEEGMNEKTKQGGQRGERPGGKQGNTGVDGTRERKKG